MNQQIQTRALELLKREFNQYNDIDIFELERQCRKCVYYYAVDHEIITNWQNPKFSEIYVHKVHSMIINIKKNPSLIKLYHYEDLVNLPSDKLNPNLWKDLIERKKQQEILRSKKPTPNTTDYICSKCKSNECIYQETQSRSADEPMTLIITCCNCRHTWKK